MVVLPVGGGAMATDEEEEGRKRNKEREREMMRGLAPIRVGRRW